MTPSPLRRMRVIWMALVVGVVAYTALAWALVSFADAGGDLFPPQVMNGAGAVAIAMMAGALLLRRTMINKIPRNVARDVRLARYSAATLVGLASVESVGLFLITLAMISGATTWILAGGGAAAVLMMTAGPSEDEIELD